MQSCLDVRGATGSHYCSSGPCRWFCYGVCGDRRPGNGARGRKICASSLHLDDNLLEALWRPHTPPEANLVAGTFPSTGVSEDRSRDAGSTVFTAGICPFTIFVVDVAVANFFKCHYVFVLNRWQIKDLCLTLLKPSLANFDPDALVTATDEVPLPMKCRLNGRTSFRLLVHPRLRHHETIAD